MKCYFEKYEKKLCVGCKSCEQACPKACINLIEDDEGFWYPAVDNTRCTNCGICIKVCPMSENSFKIHTDFNTIAYAAYNKNPEVRATSSSGGIFTALSDYVLENDGIVFGAAFNNDFTVSHRGAENKAQRECLKGSKYVQSDINETYNLVKKNLKAERQVLFTGTPCQCAGLYAYLGKAYENLINCDIICYGTPSPLLLKKYLEMLKNKYNSEINSINFRNKSIGWDKAVMNVVFDKNQSVQTQSNGTYCDSELQYNEECNTDPYYTAFYRHFMLRPSCYNCQFTGIPRNSDITIADFWGVDKVKPHLFDNKGISLTLINTNKGKYVFDKIMHNLVLEEVDAQLAMQFNHNKPASLPSARRGFIKDLNKSGIEYAFSKYCSNSFFGRARRKLLEKYYYYSCIKK